MDEKTFSKSLSGKILCLDKHRRFLQEATSRGHEYALFIDGRTDEPAEGSRFIAKDDETALEDAYQRAWSFQPESDVLSGPQFVIRSFTLLNGNRVVYQYTPPTPEEVAADRVWLWFKTRNRPRLES